MRGCWKAAVGFVLIGAAAIFFCVVLGLIDGIRSQADESEAVIQAETSEPVATEAAASTPTSQVVNTSRGAVPVPGPGFINGNDDSGLVLTTIWKVNVWARTGPSRGRVVCELTHGRPVQVDEAEYVDEEERYYLHVTFQSCQGWVPDWAVSPTCEEPLESWESFASQFSKYDASQHPTGLCMD